MRKYIVYIFCLVFIVLFDMNCISEIKNVKPLKYISSCEIDLNNDNKIDIVLLVDTIRGRELIVLMKTTDGYNSYLVSTGKSDMFLSCHFGKYIKETSAGNKEGKIYDTGGTYIKMSLPESSSVVYFWNNNAFKEIWTSD